MLIKVAQIPNGSGKIVVTRKYAYYREVALFNVCNLLSWDRFIHTVDEKRSTEIIDSAKLADAFLKLHRGWLMDAFGPLEHDPCDETKDVLMTFAAKAKVVDGNSSGAAILGKYLIQTQ